MEQLFTSIPNTVIGWIATLLIVSSCIIYFFSKVRQDDMKVLRNANNDLRDSIADNEKKIIDMNTQLQILTEKVTVLEKRNKTLEDLVVTALKQYFFENPTVASGMKDIIAP